MYRIMPGAFADMQLTSLELFCAAAERGSFTAAAKVLGVTPAAVSRSVARLEARLGARLFVRTTRSLRLTDAGETYAARCRQALRDLADAERDLSRRQRGLSGRVRLSAPTTYGHHRLLPRLPTFRARHPHVQIEVQLSNQNVALTEDDFDLAIRVRAQHDSSIVVRKLEDAELVLIASPAYLSRAGTPRSVADLRNHECIQFELPSSGRRIPWPLRIDGREQDIETTGSFVCSDDVLGGVTLARAGGGIFQAYRYVVENELAHGQLVEVLPATRGASRPINLLYPHSRGMPMRVKAFIDFLLEARATR